MANVKIVYDEERITVGDILRQEEEGTTRANMEVLAKLVMNGDGEYLSEEEGLEELKKFTIGEIRRAAEKIKEAAEGADSPK